MRDIYRPRKQRRRIGTLILAGVGILFATYIPANMILMMGKPETGKLALPVSMAAAAIILIIVAIHSTSIRQGLIAGGVLGLLGGSGCLMGILNTMTMRVEMALIIEAREAKLKAASDLYQPAQPADAGLAEASPPTAAPDAGDPAEPDPERQAPADPRKQLFAEMGMGRLAGICLPPNILLGLFIGGTFAKAAVRRREVTGR